MTGLKTYFPILAVRLGRTPVLLNEWMRALVEAKLLHSRSGRGPGSGVQLDGKSVATLLLAVLASDHRAEAVERTKALSKYLPASKTGKCRYTGAANLLDAIAIALEGRVGPAAKPAFMVRISMSRIDRDLVEMTWQQAGRRNAQNFWPRDLVSPSEIRRPPIESTTMIRRTAFNDIASDVREILAGEAAQ